MGQEKYTQKVMEALQSAQQTAALHYHQEITGIHALLALAKLSSQPLARQPVNLSQLAGFVIDDLRRGAPERAEAEPGVAERREIPCMVPVFPEPGHRGLERCARSALAEGAGPREDVLLVARVVLVAHARGRSRRDARGLRR